MIEYDSLEFLLIIVLGTLLLGYVLTKYEEIRYSQKSKDRQFELIMKSLEDKAKKDGTFKVSYFDKKSKDN